MARGRLKAKKRNIVKPDLRHGSTDLAKFINKVMLDGKKAKAQNLVYKALEIMAQKTKKEPLEIFEKVLKEAAPLIEVRSKRIGGAAYQVPTEVASTRAKHLAMIWLINATRKRKEKSFDLKLAGEMSDLLEGTGGTFKKRDEVHRMAEANKALAYLAKMR